jgi:hypothetical protein
MGLGAFSRQEIPKAGGISNAEDFRGEGEAAEEIRFGKWFWRV